MKALLKKSINKNIASKDEILSNILGTIREEESNEWIKNNLPILLLLLIKRSDNYGNGLVKEVNIIASKRLNNKEGSIYPTLHSLENKGFISSYWIKEEDTERKYYKVTRKGHAYLKEKEEVVEDIKSDRKLINREAFIWS
ncbi:PadR family transcriptional regulator [Clostridium massiliamazoniense]|uniref:PadR family transcriptional regulator n=1 Tax=Clostridium massiliamazoniense TaxID=1347366 RepID=UPI0006D7DC59|nr:PadR family transcriptional regulator [Clostridium massiliamazoniense]